MLLQFELYFQNVAILIPLVHPTTLWMRQVQLLLFFSLMLWIGDRSDTVRTRVWTQILVSSLYDFNNCAERNEFQITLFWRVCSLEVLALGYLEIMNKIFYVSFSIQKILIFSNSSAFYYDNCSPLLKSYLISISVLSRL